MAGEEFHAAMKRSTNGGGENSPMIEGEDDFYELLWQILNENNQNIKRNLWQKITGNKSNNWKNRR